MTETPGTALERRQTFAPVRVPSDDEIRRQWRLAEALASSQLFAGADEQKATAAEAFAKILVGADLGLSATQALMGVHIVKGKPQLASNLLASFVKRIPGYDFEVTTHEVDWIDVETGKGKPPKSGECSIAFSVDGVPVGISTFTMDDAKRAGLVKDGGAWATHPKNMLFARALSNGVKWYMPDVTGGVAIYTDGELESGADVPLLTAGTGDGEAQGLELGPRVEKALERAASLGHEALADRATAEIACGNRSPEKVNEWAKNAEAELDEFEKREPITEAEVVPEGNLEERAAAHDAVAAQLDADAQAEADGEGDPEAVKAMRQAAEVQRQMAGVLRTEAAEVEGGDES